MKKNVFTIFIMAVLIVGCSTEPIEEINNETFSTKQSFGLKIKQLVNNKEFIEKMEQQDVAKKSGESKGLMLLTDGYNFGPATFNNGIITFIGGSGKIEELPNGKAKFSIHTRDVEAGMFSVFTGEDLYSSDCVDKSRGVLNLSFTSEYESWSPFPGLVFYFSTGEGMSANSLNGFAEVGVPISNELGEQTGCADQSQNRIIKAKVHSNANGVDKHFSLDLH